mgnify:CR=1 FL=1
MADITYTFCLMAVIYVFAPAIRWAFVTWKHPGGEPEEADLFSMSMWRGQGD